MTTEDAQLFRRDMTELKVAVGRIETKITTMCSQYHEQHQEHLRCREYIEARIGDHEHRIGDLETAESNRGAVSRATRGTGELAYKLIAAAGVVFGIVMAAIN